MLQLCLLFGAYATVHGYEPREVEKVTEDLIQTWKLLSPTVIIRDDSFDLCMLRSWILCLFDWHNTTQLAHHLDLISRENKQDGVIFVGSQGHEELLRELFKVSPSTFSSRYPVFMPAQYEKYIQLRLDSNLIFYEETSPGKYELTDRFAVKGGHSIVEEIGHWDEENGVNLLKSMNRWERRKDLRGASIISAVRINGVWSVVKALDGRSLVDNSGNYLDDIQNWTLREVDSSGYFPGKLSIIADACNLRVKAVYIHDGRSKLLENGSYTGFMGYLQGATSIGKNLP